jgi:hypothetical protein
VDTPPRAGAVRLLVPLVFVAAAVTAVGSASQAGERFIVTRGDDPAPNGCSPTDCSLREAVITANTTPGADTIDVPRRVDLSIGGTGEDAAATGDIDILDPVSIVGASRDVSVIEANGIDRVFDVRSGATNGTFTRLTITGGSTTSSGGGLDVTQETTFTDVLVTANFAAGDGGGLDLNDDIELIDSAVTNNVANDGGGISSSDDVVLTRSVISFNTASDQGGGYENDDNLRMVDSIVANNTAADVGGGIFTDSEDTVEENTYLRSSIVDNNATNGGGGVYRVAGELRLDSSTVSGNVTNASGGGIENNDTTLPYSMIHTTVAGNRADADGNGTGNGGGVNNAATAITQLDRSLLADNTDGPTTTHPDCSGTVTSLGFNVVESVTGCTGIVDGVNDDAVGDPALAPLSNNGGGTPTHALGASTAPVDRIPKGTPGCKGSADQRGVPRPAGAGCDSGSYELRVCGDLPVTIVGTSGKDTIEGTAGDDSILALGGNDTVDGFTGNDAICGGGGRDKLFGGDGDDLLKGAGGTDKCFGEDGTDTFKGCEKKQN